jgi:tetratricopeptide (TPR) repeat protein
MTTLTRILIAMSMAASLTVVARSQVAEAPRPCERAVACNRDGVRAMNKGDVARATRLFKYEAAYSEDAQDTSQSVVAYNNLALAYAQSHEYQHALAWAHVALRFDPQNSAAHKSVESIENEFGKMTWPEDVRGTYVQYAGRGQWNSLSVSRKGEHGIVFRLLVYRMGSAWKKYGPAGYGDLTGSAEVQKGHEVTYQGDKDFPDCRITMRFAVDGAEIMQDSDCGFGYGVRASGHYERICTNDGNQCDENEFTDGPPFRP